MKRIITIGREFGAGGRELGRRLARELGIAFYDRDIILRTAKASAHLTPEQVRQWDEKVPMEFGFTQSLFNFYSRPLSEELWNAQVRAIREIANKESCVIVGRNADYILKDRKDALHTFICADLPYRAERIVRRYGESDKSPEARLHEKDKRRRVNYQHYTGRTWGQAQNYNFRLDTRTLGIEQCVDIICGIVEKSKK